MYRYTLMDLDYDLEIAYQEVNKISYNIIYAFIV